MSKFDAKNSNVLFILIIAALIVASVSLYVSFVNMSQKTASNQEQEVKDTVVVHIASGIDNPHAILMGLKTAELFIENGKKVFVFFDVKGAVAATKQNNIQYADFPQSHTIITNLIRKGATVQVCKHCLMVEGYMLSDVLDGITQLDKLNITNSPSKRVIVLDY